MPYKDPEKRREYNKQYHQDNKEKLAEYQRNYTDKNKEKLKEYHQNYRENRRENPENKEHDKAWRRSYKRKRYNTDLCFKLRNNVRRSINRTLIDGKGGQSLLSYVDWTVEELKEHLESQFESWMTWDNHGPYHPTEKRWHIDHIIPQSVLLEDVETMDHPKFRECWALKNLRPLAAIDNLSKGNKIL